MYNRKTTTGNSNPLEAWQAAVVSDRGGAGTNPARSRALASYSNPLITSRPPAHPSGSNQFAFRRLPASNPFASNQFVSRLPASKAFASNPFVSRLLAAPKDGSSSSNSSSESPRYESSASSTASSVHSSLFTSEEDISERTKAKREQLKIWLGSNDPGDCATQ